ncbi:MAG: VOC family protein [Thermoleophilia bacterium]
MAERTSHPVGAPCWADMATPQLDAVTAFYTDLFGWRATSPPGADGSYRTMTLDGLDVCAVYTMSAQRAEAGEHPGWLVYLNAPALDDTARRAAELGGRVRVEPFDVPGVGRMALIADPTGGAVALWQAGPGIGARLWGQPGAVAWNELITRDRGTAAAFLAELLGLTQEELPPPACYTVLHGPEGPVMGVMQMDDSWPAGVGSHWMTYFAVVDTNDAIMHVHELGGTVHVAPFDSPHGRVSVVSDPAGALFAVMGPAA